MEWLVALLILGAVVWAFSSKRRGRSSASQRSTFDNEGAERLSAKQRVLETNREWLDERWRMAEAEKAAGKLTHFPRWFFDEPTDRQRERLKSDGVNVSGKATKGQLSDIIGLFIEPDAEDLTKLKFYGVGLKGATRNQTRARHELAKLASDPEKERAWRMRPANRMHKEFYRFIGKKPPAGLTAEQAEATISAELEKLSAHQRDEWEAFESMVEEFEDREFLVDMGIRKPTLADIRGAMVAAKSAGEDLDDPYEIAERLLEVKPGLARGSKE